MAESLKEGATIAFAHCDNVSFPAPSGLCCNMMPFVMGDKATLPEEYHVYWKIIQKCVLTLVERASARERVGYLTIHESIVQEGFSQRRPGLHTEGFTRAPCDRGEVQDLPYWHAWGFGHAMRPGKYHGGIFLASNVDDSCHVYNAVVPEELVGKGGDVEHLRDVLNEHFPNPPKPRTRQPNDIDRYGDHAGCARHHAHMEADLQSDWRPTRGPISLQAGELFWMTDRTPHQSMPVKVGQPRQFFRLVTGGIDTWYAAHSTSNPLGVRAQAAVVEFDKFTGKPVRVELTGGDIAAGGGTAMSSCNSGPVEERDPGNEPLHNDSLTNVNLNGPFSTTELSDALEGGPGA